MLNDFQSIPDRAPAARKALVKMQHRDIIRDLEVTAPLTLPFINIKNFEKSDFTACEASTQIDVII